MTKCFGDHDNPDFIGIGEGGPCSCRAGIEKGKREEGEGRGGGAFHLRLCRFLKRDIEDIFGNCGRRKRTGPSWLAD